MLEKRVIDAVIEAESGGNPKAQSRAGAKGLMQLMDATGKEWHAKLEIKEPYDPFNIEQNRLIGSTYLNYLYEKFQDLELALAAYNWGMGNVARVLHNLDARTFSKIYNSIPAETKAYVTRIMQRVRTDEQA